MPGTTSPPTRPRRRRSNRRTPSTGRPSAPTSPALTPPRPGKAITWTGAITPPPATTSPSPTASSTANAAPPGISPGSTSKRSGRSSGRTSSNWTTGSRLPSTRRLPAGRFSISGRSSWKTPEQISKSPRGGDCWARHGSPRYSRRRSAWSRPASTSSRRRGISGRHFRSSIP